MQSDDQAIRAVHASWIDAVNAGDVARLLTLMADDVVFLNPGQDRSAAMAFQRVSHPHTNDSGSGACSQVNGSPFTGSRRMVAGSWPATRIR